MSEQSNRICTNSPFYNPLLYNPHLYKFPFVQHPFIQNLFSQNPFCKTTNLYNPFSQSICCKTPFCTTLLFTTPLLYNLFCHNTPFHNKTSVHTLLSNFQSLETPTAAIYPTPMTRSFLAWDKLWVLHSAHPSVCA